MHHRQRIAPDRPVWRRDAEGAWAVYGPHSVIVAGHTTKVARADGTTQSVAITRVGRPFRVDGVRCVYGYP